MKSPNKFAVFITVFVAMFFIGLVYADVVQNLQVNGIESLDKIENQVIEIAVFQNENHVIYISALANIDEAQSVAQARLFEALVLGKSYEVPVSLDEFAVIEQSQDLYDQQVSQANCIIDEQKGNMIAAIENRQYCEVEYVIIGPISDSHNVDVRCLYNADDQPQTLDHEIAFTYMIC